MLYKYETHSHTSEGSKCGKIDGASLARFYKSLGYTGLFITDHFYNGNTAVPRDLPWDEWVTEFMKGYQNAKAEGDKIGLDVFFAFEYTIEGNDFLIYGLGEDWLRDNPDQLSLKLRDYLNKVRADGGMVIHAHPFRIADYIDHIRLLPEHVDGVEINNTSMKADVNRRADWYAREYGLLKTAGSDNHVGARERLGGVYFTEPLSSVKDYIDFLKDGKAELFEDRYDKSSDFCRM